MGDSWFETDGAVTERTEPMSATRIERDPLGELPVPGSALYGIQTERARQNFPISHLLPLAPFIDAVVWIKKAAALTHKETGRLDARRADAIVRAADEVLAGEHREHFVVDPYQAGAGTSHNMNANEVLANRANELLGGQRGEYQPVHPNDHVNMAQSTNDVIPTAIRLAALAQLPALLEAATRLARAFLARGEAFAGKGARQPGCRLEQRGQLRQRGNPAGARLSREGRGVRRDPQVRPHPPPGRDPHP